MKGLRMLVTALVLFFVVSAGSAYAEDQKAPEAPKVTGSASLGVLNKYIFRGFELSNKSVVVQPSVTLSYRGFTLNLWGNYDSNETATQSLVPESPGKSVWNETDITLSYTYALDKWSFTGGYIYYATNYFPQSQELFLSVGYDIISKPVFSVYQNIANFPATYLNLAFSHSLPVYKDITVDLGASFWYLIGESNFWRTFESSTAGYTGSKFSSPLSGMVSAGVTVPIAKNFSVQPIMQYWFPLSGDASRKVDGTSFNPAGHIDQNFVYGLNAVFTF